MQNNLKTTQKDRVNPSGFSAFNVNSNNPDVVTTYPAQAEIIPYPLGTMLRREHRDFCRQQVNALGWGVRP